MKSAAGEQPVAHTADRLKNIPSRYWNSTYRRCTFATPIHLFRPPPRSPSSIYDIPS